MALRSCCIYFGFSSISSPAIGRRLASYIGMLRITLPLSDGPGVVVLEGRLAGLWAHELLRVARESNQGPGSIFNLQDVFYVDSSGEDALRSLSRVGAVFITDSAYGKDLCRRLKLRRISHPDIRVEQKRMQRDSRFSDQLSGSPCSSDDGPLGTQRSRCRE